MVYEVRETTNSNDPADRGRLVAFFQTYRGAFRCWQQMNAAERSVYVVRARTNTRGRRTPPQRSKAMQTSSIARGGNSLLAP